MLNDISAVQNERKIILFFLIINIHVSPVKQFIMLKWLPSSAALEATASLRTRCAFSAILSVSGSAFDQRVSNSYISPSIRTSRACASKVNFIKPYYFDVTKNDLQYPKLKKTMHNYSVLVYSLSSKKIIIINMSFYKVKISPDKSWRSYWELFRYRPKIYS